MKKISEVVDELTATKSAKIRFVENWREMIPPGSRWRPGDKGDPTCQSCKGIGYVRMDFPVGHPDFGKLFECECVNGAVIVPPDKKLNLPKLKER